MNFLCATLEPAVRPTALRLRWCLLSLLTGLGLMACGGGDGSAAAVTAPVITTQPASAQVISSGVATFSVAASGSGLAYQWRKNSVDIAGANADSYTTPATTGADNGALFTVVVSNSAGSATSNAATLTVLQPPTISTQPSPATVPIGSTATFTVVATGTAPLAYQWAKNGVAIAGATATSHTTPPTVHSDIGALFAVTVTNAAGTVTSANAALTVTPAPQAGPSRPS